MPRAAKNRKIAFEQHVLRRLRALANPPKSILIACSGGVDSVVLLMVLSRLQPVLRFDLHVAHVHHGSGQGRRYRERAWQLVKALCDELGLPLHSNSANGKPGTGSVLKSEAELRSFRWRWLRRWQAENKLDAIAVAHHYQDLLETRLMRMIRGTGPQGLVAMQFYAPPILRPLLLTEKSEILEYAKMTHATFLDDPSNEEVDVFRNWLRRWLAVLEKRHSGGVRNLGRSFVGLVERLESSSNVDIERLLTEGGINRRAFLESGPLTKKASLARYCLVLGLKDYSQGHIEELIKRLDNRQKHFTFELLHCVWSVSQEKILASRV